MSLDLVRTLVASGAIAPDDEVRDATRSNWILACAASELRDSLKTPDSELTVERRTVRDEWFCRGVSGDFGPLTLSELIQLAAEGDLKPDEDVKAKADDYWKQVCSIRRLVELLPFPDGQASNEIYSSGSAAREGGQAHISRPSDSNACSSDSIDSAYFAGKMSQSPRDASKGGHASRGGQAQISRPSDSNACSSDSIGFTFTAGKLSQSPCEIPSSIGADMSDILPFPGVQQISNASKGGQAHISRLSDSKTRSSDSIDSTYAAGKMSQSPSTQGGQAHISRLSDSKTRSSDSIDSTYAAGKMSQSPSEGNQIDLNPISLLDEDLSLDALDRLESAVNAGDSQWTGWIGGEEFGPVTYSELLTWAVTGRLSPMDFVRRGDEGQYVPAVNIPCLFTVRAAANSLSRPVKPTRVAAIDGQQNEQRENRTNRSERRDLETVPKIETTRSMTSIVGKLATGGFQFCRSFCQKRT